MPTSSLLQKLLEEEEEDDKILTMTIKENLNFPEDEDPLGQIMKKFRLDKMPKIERDVESLFTIEDFKEAREAAEIRWKEKNSDPEFDKLKNHYMDYTIRNKITDLEIAKYFDVKRMNLPRPVLPKLIYDDSELISKIEEVRAKYEKYKKEGNCILENDRNEKENENEENTEKMEIESEQVPLREMGIRLSSNIFEEYTPNSPNQQKQEQQTEQTYINLHDKQFPVTILPMGGRGRGGPSKNQSAAAATGTLPLQNLHMQPFPLNLLPNKKIILPPHSEKSASPSPASISIIKPKQTAINPQNLLKMLGALKSKQNQQMTTQKPLPQPQLPLSMAHSKSASASALIKSFDKSNVKLTLLDEDGTSRIVNTGYFAEKRQKKAEEEAKKDKKAQMEAEDKTIPEFFVCRAPSCGQAFPLNSDHLFRSHMVIVHNLELSEESILKSIGRTANIFKCLKCTSLVVNVGEHSKTCWNTGDKPFLFEEGFEQIKNKESQKSLKKPLKCGLCELQSFDTRIHLKQHFSQFHPELDRKVILDPSFRCRLCLKKFEGATSLVRHAINCEINGNRPTKETQNELARGLLYCDICGKEHLDLTESQNCYHQHSLIRCILCLFTVKTKSSFFHHVKSFHGNPNPNNTDGADAKNVKNANKKISCPFCRFCNNKSIREAFEHILSVHYTASIQRAMQNAINSQKSNYFCILPTNNPESSSTIPPAPPGNSEIFSIQNSLILTDLIDAARKSRTSGTTTTSSLATATTTTKLLQPISKSPDSADSPVKLATSTSIATKHYTMSIQRAMQNAINNNHSSFSSTPPAPPGIPKPQDSGSPGVSGNSEIFSIQNSLILNDLIDSSSAGKSGASGTTTKTSPATTTPTITTNILQPLSKSPVKIATSTATAPFPTTINLSQIHPSRIRQMQIRPGQSQNVIFMNPNNPASASGKLVRPIMIHGHGQQGTSSSSSATTATGLKYFPIPMIPIGNKGQNEKNENEDNSINTTPAPAQRQPKAQHILRPMITLIRQKSPITPAPMSTIIRPVTPVRAGNWQQQQQINIPPWIRNDTFPTFPKTFSVNVNNNNNNVNVNERMEVDGNVGNVNGEKGDDEEIIGI